MIRAKAAPTGHLSLAPWKKPLIVSGNSTVVGPPSSMGVAKTPMQVRNTRQQPDTMPSLDSGRMIRRKRVNGPAPRSAAASRRWLGIFSIAE